MSHSYSSFITHLDNKFNNKAYKPTNYSLGKIKNSIEKEFEEIYGKYEVDDFFMKNKYMHDMFEGAYSSLNPCKNKYKKQKVTIKAEINNLTDLIKMIDHNPQATNVKYNIDMDTLYEIRSNLLNLNNMIGMSSLKDNIVDQILYFSQNLMLDSEGDFMHTVIYGPPGTGKTEIAKIIGKLYSKLGVLKKNKFIKATRSDMIAGYLGQTAIKTKELIKDSLGGVLFIDEAYALGNAEGRDSFSKEAIDTLCEALSDYKDNLMVIIAGYEEELNKCFFNYNKGLDSRFTWRFKTDNYNTSELRQIFEKKIKDAGWTIEENAISDDWFESKMSYFKFYGRDMETLFCKTKIAHSRRVFCLSNKNKKKISLTDIQNGFEKFIKNDEVKKRSENHLGKFTQIYS